MPIEIIAGPLAVETLKNNEYGVWPARSGSSNRLEPLAQPNFKPSFHIKPGESIFTIGSCFARNVENALLQRGFHLPTREVLNKTSDFATIGPNILNNYGVPSIYNEIAWAFGTEPFVDEDNFFEMMPGKYVDIHLNHALRPAPLETVKARRDAIRQSYREITRCRVIIITLGLTECWYDTKTGHYINTSPRRSLIREFPDRFQFHVLSFSDTMGYLDRIFEAIRDHGHPDVRVVLTVSPVSLQATHREMDVLTANMYSKCVLRAAAEEAVRKYEFIDYYPSFESVMLSDRNLVLEDDLVHIKAPIIDLNVSRMVEAYVPDDSATGDPKKLAAALSLVPNPAPGLVFGKLENRWDAIEQVPALALLMAEAAAKLRKNPIAQRALDLVPANHEAARRLWVEAHIAHNDGDHDKVITLLAPREKQYRRTPNYWIFLIEAYYAAGRVADGDKAVEGWIAMAPHSHHPLRVGAGHQARLGNFEKADYYYRKARLVAQTDHSAIVDVDYAGFLLERGETEKAREILAQTRPDTPALATRFEELKLRAGMA